MPPGPGGPGEGTSDDCGITDIGACISEAIDGFFRGIVTAALNPLLDLLGHTLLSTPTPASLPRIGELWAQSWEILLASYILFVLIGGVIVMSYQTVQTRYSFKEIAPRLVVGFLAGALSLFVITKAIDIANALALAILGDGVDPGASASTLKTLVLNSLSGGLWIIFLGLAVAGMLIILLISYVVRVCITLLLIAGAPLALMMHALPQTDGIARAWWKAIFGCLAIQVAQSLTLVTALRVFLAPGGFTVFGPTASGLINLLVCLALFYVLIKIPFWCLSSLRHGSGRSLLGSVAYAYVMGKALGVLGHRQGGHGRARAARLLASRQSGGSTRSAMAPPARHRSHSARTARRPPTGTQRPRRSPSGSAIPPRALQFQQAAPQNPNQARRPGSPTTNPTPPRFSAAPPPGSPPHPASSTPTPPAFQTATPNPSGNQRARTHSSASARPRSSRTPPQPGTPQRAAGAMPPPKPTPAAPPNPHASARSRSTRRPSLAQQPPRSSAHSRSTTSATPTRAAPANTALARPRPVVAPVFQPPAAPPEPTPQPVPPSPTQQATPTTGTPTSGSPPLSARTRKPARRTQPANRPTPPGGEIQ